MRVTAWNLPLARRALKDAANAAGVSHFVFTSACTGPDDPVDFFQVKYAIEQYLRASGLPFTILRQARSWRITRSGSGGP